MLGQFQSSRNIAGIVSQKYADRIFLLRDLPLEVGDFGGGGVHQLLGLAHVQQRVDSGLLQLLRQLQRVLRELECALRNFQFQVQLAKLKVIGGHVGDQSRHDFFLGPLVGQQIRSRRFCRAAILSPEIQIPCRRRGQLALRDFIGRNRADLGDSAGW